MARLERLGDPALDVARAVCVLGPDAVPGFVARLADIPPDDLDLVVRALASEGILAPGDGAALASAHPLVGDAVLAGLGDRRAGPIARSGVAAAARGGSARAAGSPPSCS